MKLDKIISKKSKRELIRINVGCYFENDMDSNAKKTIENAVHTHLKRTQH